MPRALHANTLALVLLPGAAAGQVVVNEVMAEPARVDDALGEWIELRNAGSSSANLGGMALRVGAQSYTFPNGARIGAGELFVCGRVASQQLNGGAHVDHEYGSALQLAATEVTVELMAPDGGAAVASEVVPAAAAGKSWERCAGDGGVAWVAALTPYGSGDLGTPGAENRCGQAGVADAGADGPYVFQAKGPGAVSRGCGGSAAALAPLVLVFFARRLRAR
jgi:hypothetical protein